MFVPPTAVIVWVRRSTVPVPASPAVFRVVATAIEPAESI
jgi:hypothetical protein